MEDPKKKEILISDFFQQGVLEKRLICDEEGQNNVQKLGESLCETLEEEYIDKRSGKKKKNKINATLTINQIRKYYDSFLKIYNAQVNEETKKIQLLMLKANSEYSAERLSTFRFGMFMNNRINIVVKRSGVEFQKYLDAFKLHFEALVGYYPRDKKEKEQ